MQNAESSSVKSVKSVVKTKTPKSEKQGQKNGTPYLSNPIFLTAMKTNYN
jgi:hypothetical protein